MERPRSIVMFERCYLGALGVGFVNTIIHWSTYLAMPQVQQAQAMFGGLYLPTTTALGFVIPLILWYFVARRASAVAKWIVVIFVGLGLLGLVSSMALGSLAGPVAMLLGVTVLALDLIAAWFLFRPDAKAWFGEPPHTSPSI